MSIFEIRLNLLLVLILPLCFLNQVGADETYWDTNLVRAYVHNSDMQRRWAWSFLAPHLKLLKGDEHILDIGCGDGKITADVSRFVPNGFIVGIDPSEPMLEWARKQFDAKEYGNLQFRKGGFIEPNLEIQDTFNVIVSNCSLQHCKDQKAAFTSLERLLKPNGKLLILMSTRNNPIWNDACKTIQGSEKWKAYWENVPPRKIPLMEDMTKLLIEVGLELASIERKVTVDPFVDRNEFVEFLMGTFSPVVPREFAKEFYNEIIDEYVRLKPDVLNDNGVIEARFGRIEIVAYKKGV